MSSTYTSPHYRELRPINCWDLLASLRHSSNFNGFRVLSSLLKPCRSPEANQTLHDVNLAVSWAATLYTYTSGGFCPLTKVCPVQNSLHVQALRSRILAALLHGSSSGHQPKFAAWYKEYRITELSQRAPPIFGRAVVTLGIGPHSIFSSIFTLTWCILSTGTDASLPIVYLLKLLFFADCMLTDTNKNI